MKKNPTDVNDVRPKASVQRESEQVTSVTTELSGSLLSESEIFKNQNNRDDSVPEGKYEERG